MKKSILVLALPCLVALTLVVSDVLASNKGSTSDGFYCAESEQTCYQEILGCCTIIKTAKGKMTIFRK